MIKAFAGFKTLAFNGLMVVIFALNQFGAFGADVEAPTADQVDAVLTSGVDAVDKVIALLAAIGNAVLRFGTNTTVFKATSPAPSPETSK